MTTELVAQRGDHLHRRRILLAAGEAGEERRGDDRHRDRVVDGRFHGPATLTGVVGVAAQLRQAGVGFERDDQQVQQPGADDGALRSSS